MVRDLTINCRDDDQAKTIVDAVQALSGFKLLHHSDRTFLLHLGGKIEVVSREPIRPETICRWCTHLAWRACVWLFTNSRRAPIPSRSRRTP